MPAEVSDELSHLTQSLEVEEVRRRSEKKGRREIADMVGGVKGDGGMAAIGQAHDDVRSLAVADADDGQLLPTQRVMGMGDRH